MLARMRLAVVERAFAPLLGLPCWQAQAGYGTTLTFEFGQPHLIIDEPTVSRRHRLVTVRGRWHLLIYLCDWTIDLDGTVLCTSDSGVSELDQGVSQLDGQRLTGVMIDPATARTRFESDLGGGLTTQPSASSTEEEQWMLVEPSGTVLRVRAGGHVAHQPGDTPPENAVWHPLLTVCETPWSDT
jgi:hypothetical protein